MNFNLFLLLKVQTESDKFIDYFFSLSNPILYAILFVFIFLILLLLYNKNIISPIKTKHESEKTRLIERHVKQMALFAELDPNPLLRVDSNAIIINENSAAKLLHSEDSLIGKKITEILSLNNINLNELITSNSFTNFSKLINKNYYSIIIKGVSEFNAVQIYFNNITNRITAEKKLKDYQAKFTQKVEEERLSIAKELHDGIGQELSLLRLDIQKQSENLSNNKLNSAISTIEQISKDLREVCNQLRPRILEEEGIIGAITSLILNVNSRTSVKAEISLIGEDFRLSMNEEINIFRVVQEAVNNILKHSKAKSFTVQILNNKNNILIMITDDGTGFNLNEQDKTSGGFGLLNMKERIESINGCFRIDTNSSVGTTVIIDLLKKDVNE